MPPTKKTFGHLPIYEANFHVAGVGHEGRAAIVARLARPGMKVTLARDPANRYSRVAVAILLDNGKQIGFAPEEEAQELAPYLDRHCPVRAVIAQIWPTPDGAMKVPIMDVEVFARGTVIQGASVMPALQREFPSSYTGAGISKSVWWGLLALFVLAVAWRACG